MSTTSTLLFSDSFYSLRPPATYLSRSHSSILSSALASSVVSSISFSLLPASRTHARTHAPSDIRTHWHSARTRARPRSLSRYIRRTRARFLASRYPLTTSASICLLCKSRLTGADGDNENSDSTESAAPASTDMISLVSAIGRVRLVIASRLT